jgi:hypothetical protein
MNKNHQLQYGETTIEYNLTYSERKTLGITVHPDLSVTVNAPEDADFPVIEQRIRKRASWIMRQKRELERYLPHLPPHQYVSGETHLYLGRQYRLKVVEVSASGSDVKMKRGRLYVYIPDKEDKKKIQSQLELWYRLQADRVFNERLEAMQQRFQHIDMPLPELRIKVLRSRWGSCTNEGLITLNLKLMQVPKLYIDYVIVHELCHLVEHNHSKRFYILLDRMMPDWRQRRQELNEFDFR